MECSVSFEGYIIKGKPVKKWSCMIDSFTNVSRNSSRKYFRNWIMTSMHVTFHTDHPFPLPNLIIAGTAYFTMIYDNKRNKIKKFQKNIFLL